ncbi:hypothetical protein [Streptomyces sp. NPDC001933]|uniref:hypothetical protein n=1 Tax=Streptomyces sp. NPDC001933 TaxID=3364626 RepID=UPI0036B44062
MPDGPTLGEVMRRLEDARTDLKDDFRELGLRLDSKVSLERYQLEQVAREQAARNRRDEDQRAADRRAADRRLIFTALIAPVLLLILTAYLNEQGAGHETAQERGC